MVWLVSPSFMRGCCRRGLCQPRLSATWWERDIAPASEGKVYAMHLDGTFVSTREGEDDLVSTTYGSALGDVVQPPTGHSLLEVGASARVGGTSEGCREEDGSARMSTASCATTAIGRWGSVGRPTRLAVVARCGARQRHIAIHGIITQHVQQAPDRQHYHCGPTCS